MDLSTQRPSRWATSAIKNAAKAGHLPTAAATLARAGIPVFPCVRRGKQPLTAHGFHNATTDLQQVRRWWKKMPEANIGIPTGSASGLVVVDVDVHRTGDGFRAFSTEMETGLTQRWAWMVRTPSGGMHAYFAATPGVEQRNWSLPSRHVDFRGDGGYVVAPPSIVETSAGTRRPYSLIGFGRRPGTVDSVALNQHLAPPAPPRHLPATLPAAGSSPERLAAWVARRPEGARNGGLFWAACRMAEAGHDFAQTSRILGDAASSAGLPDVEAFKTIRSAYRTATRLGPSPGTNSTDRNQGLVI
ncbi:bifunctional DNA primase/polymerase [Nocardioides sp. NPDC058538]|uniref:bifunctional DNA primase/polymerase n=1 Tax=Nocardioides sp. NPDC058538 TaxID=3346542 RepID=UPI003669CC56